MEPFNWSTCHGDTPGGIASKRSRSRPSRVPATLAWSLAPGPESSLPIVPWLPPVVSADRKAVYSISKTTGRVVKHSLSRVADLAIR